MTINVLPFMHGPNGEMAGLEIEILEYKDLGITGECKIGVTLKHPYPELPEFSGFDVMGLFIADGAGVGIKDPSLRYPIRSVDPVLLNADGYTRWMNPTEFPDDAPFGFVDTMSDDNSGFIANATVNGYKYYADGIAAEQDVANYFSDPAICAQRGLFSYGSECTRNYIIQFPVKDSVPQIFFNYAVLASWEEPIPNPPDHIPFDFPPKANAQFPIYAKVIDYSTLYYNDGNSGGDIVLDVELFDWSNYWDENSFKDKIGRVVLESRDELIDDNHWEAPGGILTYVKGESDISTHLLLQVPGNPSAEGYQDLFLAIELSPQYDYNQGHGETTPNAPMAIYLRPTVEIGTCPGAIITGMSSTKGCSDEDWKDVTIFGSSFMDGPDLDVRLENESTGMVITGYNTELIDSEKIKTSFDLKNIFPGVFDLVCTNGCGTESRPPENLPTWDGKVKIVSAIPTGVTPSTQRSGISPSIVESLHLSWNSALHAQAYRIYIDADPYSQDGYSGLKDNFQLLATTTKQSYDHTESSLVPFNNHRSYTYIVKSYYNLGTGDGESKSSNLVYYSGQDFTEFNKSNGSGLGKWGYIMQTGNPLLNNIMDNGYSGKGFSFDKDLTGLSYSVWLVFHTPYIPEMPKATKAYLEFNHRHSGFKPSNGYFVGYTTLGLPEPYNNSVSGVKHVDTLADGAGYNDWYSPALMQEFNFYTSYIHNFQKSGGGWWGWYFSRFDLSDALEGSEGCYALIGMGFSEIGTHKFELDDCALLVY